MSQVLVESHILYSRVACHCTSLFLSPSLHFPSSVPRALFPPRCAPPQPPYICSCTYWGAGRHCMLGGFAPGKLARVVYQRVLYRRDLRATYARLMRDQCTTRAVCTKEV